MLDRRVGTLVVALLASAVSGCLPISVSRYGTAEPIQRGEVAVDGGFDLADKSQAYGVDEGKVDGQGIGEHHSGYFVPALEVRYGITDMIEVSAKGWLPVGGQVGARASFIDESTVKLALGIEAGAWSGADDNSTSTGSGPTAKTVSTHRSYQGNYETLYANLTLRSSDTFAVYGGPLLTRLWARKHLVHSDTSLGGVTQVYTSTNAIDELGGFVGLAIGPPIAQFCPGVTFYREADRYPIQKWQGNGWYAFPWVGVSIRPGYHKAKNLQPGAPPVEPPPQ